MFLYHRILVKYVNIIPTLQLTHDKLQAHFIENETSFPPRDIILHVYFSNTRVTRDRVGDTLSSGFQRDFLLILVGNEFYGTVDKSGVYTLVIRVCIHVERCSQNLDRSVVYIYNKWFW